MPKHLSSFPKPLLDDLVRGKWLPIVGAGLSRNATLPTDKKMPLWGDLGALFEADLGEYRASNPVDAISAYEHEFGRPKMVERLSDVLHIAQSRPGTAHKAFCSIPFDLVCTTNFDFLLERQYEALGRHCTPLIDEAQLSISLNEPGVGLLKLHGDLNHPERMVVTETDYDRFLSAYPLVATYLANLLITRSAVLIGYSLDDPDFRQIWHVVKDRLGAHKRIAYAISVGAKPSDVSRFDRRGVRVINLAAGRSSYGDVLAEAFEELATYWRDRLIGASQVKDEQPLRELTLPPDASTRLCFFAVPLKLLPFYRERVFPIANRHGFVPVSADDVVSPGDTVQAKIEVLIQRALIVVVDPSTQNTVLELNAALRAKGNSERVLVITQPDMTVPFDFRNLQVIFRQEVTEDSEEFLTRLDGWFAQAARMLKPLLAEEPLRLLGIREYRAAVIAAISLLEARLRERLDMPRGFDGRRFSLTNILQLASEQGLLANVSARTAMEWVRLRNQIVHAGHPVNKMQAEQIVSGVLEILANAG